MKKINLTALTIVELQGLQADIDKELLSRESKVLALEEAKQVVASKGLKLEDLLQELGFAKVGVRVKRELGPVPVRFRHPDNPSLTWTGRGKRPNWMRDALASGFTEDQFKV